MASISKKNQSAKAQSAANKNGSLGPDPSKLKANFANSAANSTPTYSVASSVSSGSYSSNLANSLTVSNTSSNWNTTGITTSLGSLYVTREDLESFRPDNQFLRLYVLSHEEEEIKSALTKVKEICITYEDNRSLWESIVEDVLKVKHFSEDFIINYLDEINDKERLKNAILFHHKGDVYSNSYPTVALKILIDK